MTVWQCKRSMSAAALACIVAAGLVGCGGRAGWDSSAGVVVRQAGGIGLGDRIAAAVNSAPARAMKGSGLAGAMGGVHVRFFRAGTYDLLIPVPQKADGQVPLYYEIRSTPEQALVECRLQRRADGNAFLNVRLKGGKDQDGGIDWSSVVLLAGQFIAQNPANPETYLTASPCAQSDDPQVKELAEKLWPASGKADEFAKAIQGHIRDMKQQEKPLTMDAVGILKSGGNWICTANANLAAALMRARGVPCRSIAVIPPTSQRLEMHRVVEYFDGGRWVPFDPSLLQADIPLKPWQSIIMAKTTPADEEKSMKPRFSSAPGCPFGQELEMAKMGLGLSGQDFYWTIAAPLAEFDVSDEAVALTAAAWENYLKSGTPDKGQIKAVAAKSLEEYLSALKPQ
jgi:hypothetical protein